MLKSMPPATSKDRATKRSLEALNEAVDIGNNLRGNPLDQNITLRSLIAMGGAKVVGALRAGRALREGEIQLATGRDSFAIPERMTELTAKANYQGVILTWKLSRNTDEVYAEIYRSTQDLFSSAVMISRERGSHLFDKTVLAEQTYYYWGRFVSPAGEGPLNATAGIEVTVPKSAEQLLADLSGEIKETHLHQSLSTDIATLKTESSQLAANAISFINAEYDAALSLAKVATVERTILTISVGGDANLAALEGLVATEATARADQDTLLINQINTVSSKADEVEAAVQDTNTALASADLAMGLRVGTVETSIGEVQSSIETIESSVSTKTEALAERSTTLEADFNSQELTNTGNAFDLALNQAESGEVNRAQVKINQKQIVLAQEDVALSERITTLDASLAGNTSKIESVESAMVTADESLASQISQLNVTFGEDVAAIQETLTAKASKTDEPYAMWEIKTTVNGITGSIGLFNNGQDVAVGINARQLYVFDGNDPDQKLLPFVVDGNSTYINMAFIKKASIDEAMIGSVDFNVIRDADGNAIATDVNGIHKLRADLIDVDNLTVSSAATFSGDVSSTGKNAGGQSLWEIKQNGSVTFRDITVEDGTFTGLLSTVKIKGPPLIQAITGTATGNATVQDEHDFSSSSPTGIEFGAMPVFEYYLPSNELRIPNKTIVNPETGLLWVHLEITAYLTGDQAWVVPYISYQKQDDTWTTPTTNFNKRLRLVSREVVFGSSVLQVFEGFINVFGGDEPLIANIDTYKGFKIYVSGDSSFEETVRWRYILGNSHYRNL